MIDIRRPLVIASAIAALLAASFSPAGAYAADPRDNQRPVYGSTWTGPLLDPLDARVEAMMTMLEGQYRGSWPGAFAKKPEVESVPAWAVWKRVTLPAFGSRVMFLEVRESGPEGRIVRQRIVSFSDDPERSHNYAYKYVVPNFEAHGRADLHPEKLAHLTPRNVTFFGRGCQNDIIGDGPGFYMGAAKSSCVLVYPDGKVRYNQADIRVRPGGWEFFEAAYDIDGNFGSGNRTPSVFVRLEGTAAR